MANETFKDIEKLESDLWEAADLAPRLADFGAELAADETISPAYERRATSRLVKQLDEERKTAVEQLKHAVYFHRQVAWLKMLGWESVYAYNTQTLGRTNGVASWP